MAGQDQVGTAVVVYQMLLYSAVRQNPYSLTYRQDHNYFDLVWNTRNENENTFFSLEKYVRVINHIHVRCLSARRVIPIIQKTFSFVTPLQWQKTKWLNINIKLKHYV